MICVPFVPLVGCLLPMPGISTPAPSQDEDPPSPPSSLELLIREPCAPPEEVHLAETPRAWRRPQVSWAGYIAQRAGVLAASKPVQLA